MTSDSFRTGASVPTRDAGPGAVLMLRDGWRWPWGSGVWNSFRGSFRSEAPQAPGCPRRFPAASRPRVGPILLPRECSLDPPLRARLCPRPCPGVSFKLPPDVPRELGLCLSSRVARGTPAFLQGTCLCHSRAPDVITKFPGSCFTGPLPQVFQPSLGITFFLV